MSDSKYKHERETLLYLFESEPQRSWSAKEIVRLLGFRGKQIPRLHGALRELTREGTIVSPRKGNLFTLGQPPQELSGTLRMVRNGAGNITGEDGRLIWIAAHELDTALHGDTVAVSLYRAQGETRGRVTRIVERCQRDIVGTLGATGDLLHVTPLNPVYRKDFAVARARGAKPGDRVVMRLIAWEDRSQTPRGEIVEVIGPADDPSLDTLTVMKQFDLPLEFPASVLDEAETVAQRLTRPGQREDLRKAFTFTIDPATARDFDDALSLTRDERGNRVLGVHIADVGHFVRSGTALDREARARGTSVYLVDKVIPMLPEQLSNGVCSLHPGEERLTFSVFMTFNREGRMIARRFARTRLRSSLRLNYEQALALLGKPATSEAADQAADQAALREGNRKIIAQLGTLPSETRPTLRAIWRLAEQLRRRRFALAALDLEVPEVEIILDEQGRMSGMEVRPYDASHQLIEECMVAANEAVATELWTRGIKIPARLHEPPDPEKLEELQANLALLGFKPGNLSEPRQLARFLQESAAHPLAYHAHVMVLRSMKRAVYSAEKIGHFGLAKSYYAHFTAPIRRYPDLVLHRQLAAFLAGGGGKLPTGELAGISLLATEREQIADDASRQLIEIKKFRFLQQQLDDKQLIVYQAVVAKCTNYGLFIDLPELAMGGMIHISQLSRHFVHYNHTNESLSAAGVVYRIGTRLPVRVATVDFNSRRADFVPYEEAKKRPRR